MMVYRDCSAGRPWLVVALGMASALLAVGGGGLSWAGRPGGGAGTHRFIATMGVLAAGVFLVAILGQTLAGLFFTGCEG